MPFNETPYVCLSVNLTTTLTVYKFAQLNKASKEYAKQKEIENFGYSFESETRSTMQALAKHFDCELREFDVDFFYDGSYYVRFHVPHMNVAEINKRLTKLGSYDKKTGRGHGDCVLTGWCRDEDCIDGFRAAWRAGVKSLEKLLQAAAKSLIKVARADCDEQYTDSTFADFCEANDYQFYAGGKLVPRKAKVKDDGFGSEAEPEDEE
jgi:hypothetical protein